MTDTKVAGYVAKYATKAAECTGTLDRRLAPAVRIADLSARDHARRHIAACLRLGKLPQLKNLRLAAWAHMLGFRGHFSITVAAYLDQRLEAHAVEVKPKTLQDYRHLINRHVNGTRTISLGTGLSGCRCQDIAGQQMLSVVRQ